MSEKIEIINGVEIKTEGNTKHFTPIEDKKENIQEKTDNEDNNSSWFSRLMKKLFGQDNVVPYVKIRNLSDPFDDKNYEGGTKSGIEVGVKVSF